MRQLSLLVATTVAFFVIVSLFLMSRTPTIHSQAGSNFETSAQEASKLDEIARQASRTSLDLLETGLAQINPITPALTQGHAIMPQLNNETAKYKAYLAILIE
jgi:hypothetical protein